MSQAIRADLRRVGIRAVEVNTRDRAKNVNMFRIEGIGQAMGAEMSDVHQ
jgi:hypothetical protein